MAPILVPAVEISPDRPTAAEVATRLRRRIAAHTIPPGARLREWDVAGEFSIPRLTAREALDILDHQGFVVRQPNRGVLVPRRDLAEVLQLLELREVNEGLAARRAARLAAPESWDDLITEFGAPMEAIVGRQELDAYVRVYDRLHERLITAAACPPLTDLLHRLNDMTAIYGRRVLLVSDRTQHALDDHRAVLSALRRGNAATAERARRAAIANVRAAVERYHSFVL